MTVMFRGLPACECLAEWLPVYERELQETGNLVGPLKIYQLIGNASASADTHQPGGAYDVTDGTLSQADVLIGRQMGAAEFLRMPPDVHHTTPPRRAARVPPQRRRPLPDPALDAGFNRLGKGGRGGPDDGPRDFEIRTWREGIAWAKRRQRIRSINGKIAEARAAIDNLNDQIAAARDDKARLQAKVADWIETRDSL